MQPRINIITLAVNDLERALRFYHDGLGFESDGIIGTEWAGDAINPAGAAAMCQMDNGFILALYPRSELAKDGRVPLGAPKTGEFSIGQLVDSRADVDGVLAQARAAGATITKTPIASSDAPTCGARQSEACSTTKR